MSEEPSVVVRPALATPLALYIGGTVALAMALVAVSWAVYGLPKNLVALAILCAMSTASHALRELNVGSRVGFSFLSIILLASIPIVGPVGCAIVGGVAMILELGHVWPRVRLFNTAMNVTYGALGGLLYLICGGASDVAQVHGAGQLMLHVGLPLLIADAAQMFTNAALLAGIMRVDGRMPFRVMFVQMIGNSGVAYLGYGVIGFLFVMLWGPADVGPFSALLILAPLFVARWAFVQYGDEQRSHESALSALVSAVETKDPYAAGHSARIALLSQWVGEPLGLGAQEVQALRFAAMLHDVGKVGLPTRIVQRPGEMSREDLEILEQHPDRGADLLAGIDFLAGSLDGIRHHHERFDGCGYPAGLVGDAIPMAARIIAVADAFDSLTMPRPHRPALTVLEALVDLESRSGGQFDPRVVEALARATERHDWAPGAVDEDTLAAMTGYFDHDDPVASDLGARLRAPAPVLTALGPQAGP
ncbi:MAG: HD-GYP domain-containing protein [Lapillicoccus sp.]